jgi:SAM-dependent methyltransferase
MLDVGTAFAPPIYQQLLSRLQVAELHGVDLVPFEVRNVRPAVADVRSLPFAAAWFDVVVCVSTLEHIGLDNSIYFNQAGQRIEEEGDLTALRELARVTRTDGRILLTLPAGRARDFGWQRQYSPERFRRLVEAAGLSIHELELFEHDTSHGWSIATPEAIEERSYGIGAPAAAAVICASLRH